MIRTATFILLIISIASCTSTQSTLDTDYPDRIRVNPPHQTAYVEKEIHIRSVDKHQAKRSTVLVIEGDFPNPCTQILRVDDKRFPQTFSMKIIGWQKYQEACMQTITPFTFIYQNETVPLETLDTVRVNGISFDLKDSSSLK